MELPMTELETLARRDGLKKNESLQIRLLDPGEVGISVFLFRKARGYYHPESREITINSDLEKKPKSMAMVIAHEAKHRIDMQGWPSWFIYFSYIFCVLTATITLGTMYYLQGHPLWLVAIVVAGTYLSSYYWIPWEISANVYMRRRWRDYYQAIYGQPPD